MHNLNFLVFHFGEKHSNLVNYQPSKNIQNKLNKRQKCKRQNYKIFKWFIFFNNNIKKI